MPCFCRGKLPHTRLRGKVLSCVCACNETRDAALLCNHVRVLYVKVFFLFHFFFFELKIHFVIRVTKEIEEKKIEKKIVLRSIVTMALI